MKRLVLNALLLAFFFPAFSQQQIIIGVTNSNTANLLAHENGFCDQFIEEDINIILPPLPDELTINQPSEIRQISIKYLLESLRISLMNTFKMDYKNVMFNSVDQEPLIAMLYNLDIDLKKTGEGPVSYTTSNTWGADKVMVTTHNKIAPFLDFQISFDLKVYYEKELICDTSHTILPNPFSTKWSIPQIEESFVDKTNDLAENIKVITNAYYLSSIPGEPKKAQEDRISNSLDENKTYSVESSGNLTLSKKKIKKILTNKGYIVVDKTDSDFHIKLLYDKIKRFDPRSGFTIPVRNQLTYGIYDNRTGILVKKGSKDTGLDKKTIDYLLVSILFDR